MSLYSLFYNILTALFCLLSLKFDLMIIKSISVFLGITALFAPIFGALYRFKNNINEKNSSSYDAFSIAIAFFTFEYSLNLILGTRALSVGLLLYVISVIVFLEINRKEIIIEQNSTSKKRENYKRKISILSILCMIVDIVLYLVFIVLYFKKVNEAVKYFCVILAFASPLYPIFVKNYRINNHIQSKINNALENISACFVFVVYYNYLTYLLGIKIYAAFISVAATLVSLFFHKKIYPYYDDYKKYEPLVNENKKTFEEKALNISRENEISALIKEHIEDKEYTPESFFYAREEALFGLYKDHIISKSECLYMAKLEIKTVILDLLKTIIITESDFYNESFSVDHAAEYAYKNCITDINNIDELESKINQKYSGYNSRVREKAKIAFPQIYVIYKTYINNIMDKLSDIEDSYKKIEKVDKSLQSQKLPMKKEKISKDNKVEEQLYEDSLNNNYTKNKTTNHEKLYCRKCGTELVIDSEFCYKCGTKVIRI